MSKNGDEMRAALKILHRGMAVFADSSGQISPGCDLHGVGSLTLALYVSDQGAFRFNVIDREETGPDSFFMKMRFEATGTLAGHQLPTATVFDRGPWERTLLTMDA